MNSTKQKTILVVEDDATLNSAFVTILKKEGFHAISAYDGAEALAIVNDEKDIHLILLDLLMPNVSGIEFLQQFDVKKAGIPVIIFSNLDAKKDIDTAYSLGAERYLLKAWASPKQLAQIVHETLKSRVHSSSKA